MHVGWIKQARIVNGPYASIVSTMVAIHIAVTFGSNVVRRLPIQPPISMTTWILFWAACMFAIAIPGFRHRRRRTRFIREHNGHICTSCGYLLTPELDHKPCPECGTPIDLALYRTQWIQALGRWKQFPPP